MMTTRLRLRGTAALATLGLAGILLAGCAGGQAPAGEPDATMSLTFINPAPGQPVWQKAAECFTAAAEAAGVRGQVVGAPGANASTNEQLRFIEQAVAQGADGIISTSFTGDTAVESAFQKARDAGVFVATMESGDATQARNFDVGIDITQFGRDVAQQIAEFPGEHRVAMLLPGLSGTPLQFQEAFEDEIGDLDNVSLAQVISDDGVVTDDAALVGALLTADPTVTHIVAPNPGSIAGVLTAIREAGREGEVFLVSNSIQEPAPQGIEDGTVAAAYVQNICDVGELAVENMLALKDGKDVERSIPVGTDFVTKDTFADLDRSAWF